MCSNLQNCYMNNNLQNARNVILCNATEILENCMDCVSLGWLKSDNIYASMWVGHNCHNVYCSIECSPNCSNIYYSYLMDSCSYCLGCIGLKNKSFCIFNKQYTKEEYEIAAKDILKDRDSRKAFQEKFEALATSSPKKNVNNVGAEWCFANYVQNGKNNIFCDTVLEGMDNKYSSFTGIAKNGAIYDGYATTNSGYTLETCWFDGVKSAFILTGEYGTNDSYYCQHVNDAKNCFGCIWLKHKKYCILNKQYSEKEYEVLVSKIIEQMQKDGERGENFPIKFSTFGYNETVAQTFYPLTKQEALSRWYKWQDLEYAINIPKWLETIQWKDLPKTIDEVTDDTILNKVIICEKTGKPYRIIKQELDFYRKHNIPLPTQHQDTRKDELFKKRMPKEFHIIPCTKCNQEMLSVYNANIWWKIYCESCYSKEIYW